MIDAELEQLKKRLLSTDGLSDEYMADWESACHRMLDEANNPSEFPTSKRILNHVQEGIARDTESYLKRLPVELEANAEALIVMIARNNQRVLRLLELMTKPNGGSWRGQ